MTPSTCFERVGKRNLDALVAEKPILDTQVLHGGLRALAEGLLEAGDGVLVADFREPGGIKRSRHGREGDTERQKPENVRSHGVPLVTSPHRFDCRAPRPGSIAPFAAMNPSMARN
jgi:hypothetical protein